MVTGARRRAGGVLLLRVEISILLLMGNVCHLFSSCCSARVSSAGSGLCQRLRASCISADDIRGVESQRVWKTSVDSGMKLEGTNTRCSITASRLYSSSFSSFCYYTTAVATYRPAIRVFGQNSSRGYLPFTRY